jgi:hypothetical protein
MTASLSPKFGCGPVRHFKWSRSQCTCNPGFDVTRRPAATQNVGDTSRSHGELFAILCGVRAGTKFVNSTSMVFAAIALLQFALFAGVIIGSQSTKMTLRTGAGGCMFHF